MEKHRSLATNFPLDAVSRTRLSEADHMKFAVFALMVLLNANKPLENRAGAQLPGELLRRRDGARFFVPSLFFFERTE